MSQNLDQWVAIQQKLLIEDEGWIMDGDLGWYDVIDVRLHEADTIIFLDFSFLRCAWRAIRRARERADFWRWLLAYRHQSRPILMKAIATHAARADLHVFRNPRALGRFVAHVARVDVDEAEVDLAIPQLTTRRNSKSAKTLASP